MMRSDIIQTIDVVLLSIKNDRLYVALVQRDKSPYQHQYALPGGYVHAQEDEDCLASAVRVLKTKTGISSPYLEQLASFSGKYRDPRGWSVTVVYFALVSLDVIEQSANASVRLFDVQVLKELPFDHANIINVAVSRIRNKAQYSSLPCFLAGSSFTLPALQKVYEICLGDKLNKVSFRRKIDDMGILEELEGALSKTGAYRPAKIYQLKKAYVDELKILNKGL